MFAREWLLGDEWVISDNVFNIKLSFKSDGRFSRFLSNVWKRQANVLLLQFWCKSWVIMYYINMSPFSFHSNFFFMVTLTLNWNEIYILSISVRFQPLGTPLWYPSSNILSSPASSHKKKKRAAKLKTGKKINWIDRNRKLTRPICSTEVRTVGLWLCWAHGANF